ncbi:putative transcriptional regulator PhnF [Sulfitobacter indolifex]|uniref:Transcriptional regulator, GntR family protein n=1 Tax=Sulfitobacter indolifex HEL-45 TaxID=391624 RepID=A0ABP2DB53_9RHOB|nr:phosphonate metabolism transcriptional regulator PhnF [Sulfitobacter indolifex]EDQ05385.1 transcriptional regulator, GntR family protein [Sulfitobacter indolifex HEL-45]UOA19560.1 putative transcriptional regulator PhnF [Sulfitobacter indolifex]
MARTAIWKNITATLTRDIATGKYAPGDRLPTEAQLAARFGVNRHTVRRAISNMNEGGLTYSRRGAGVFVAQRPTDYAIGKRVRFHQNLAAAGRVPAKEILTLETRAASAHEADHLGLEYGALVHVYEGLSLADSQPIAIFRSLFPAARFPDLLAALETSRSVTSALAQGGVADYTRASTRLTAKLANATQALHLRLSEGAPILRSAGINVDPDGVPVEYGVTWFAGDRVTLTLNPGD